MEHSLILKLFRSEKNVLKRSKSNYEFVLEVFQANYIQVHKRKSESFRENIDLTSNKTDFDFANDFILSTPN